MKSNPKKINLACYSVLLFLASCGGGSDTSITQLTGSVIDGYIEGAKVCLDLNGNGSCEVSEPGATTDAKGAYTLVTTGINTTGLNVIAEIPETAKDSDDAGKTLKEAGKTAYTMASTADKPAVITPLTTLLVGKIKTDKLSMEDATAKVLEQGGLRPDTNLHEDHVAKGNEAVRAAARQVAGQLQQLQASLPAGGAVGDKWTELQKIRDSVEKQAGMVAKTSADSLNMPSALSALADGELFAYKMTSAKGKLISATAMLFKPKRAAPSAGWPLVVFGHGTVGVAQQCAPSVTMKATGQWSYAPLVAALVAQGIAVVAPDYEGLGSADMGVEPGHPYLDLRSAGQSMALSAVAAKKNLSNKLSGDWVSLGHSQGGHAALASAQFSGLAKQLESGLTYKGAVAIAPASNLSDSLNLLWSGIEAADLSGYQDAYANLGTINGYSALLTKGSESTTYPVQAREIFGSSMQSLYKDHVATKCLEDFSALLSADITAYAMKGLDSSPKNYLGVKVAVVNSPKVQAILTGNEPGQVKLPGKTLIVQGNADTTVLPAITQKLVAAMKKVGSDVTPSYHDGAAATHSGVLGVPAAQQAIAFHLASLFGLGGGSGSQASN